jgi:hypothetical protein
MLLLNTANNLDSPYKDQGKLDEAGKMYQRILQRYKKVLGPVQVPTYTPALSTIENFALLLA